MTRRSPYQARVATRIASCGTPDTARAAASETPCSHCTAALEVRAPDTPPRRDANLRPRPAAGVHSCRAKEQRATAQLTAHQADPSIPYLAATHAVERVLSLAQVVDDPARPQLLHRFDHLIQAVHVGLGELSAAGIDRHLAIQAVLTRAHPGAHLAL